MIWIAAMYAYIFSISEGRSPVYISFKIIENSYNNNLLQWWSREKGNLYLVTVATNIRGIMCTLSVCEEDLDKN